MNLVGNRILTECVTKIKTYERNFMEENFLFDERIKLTGDAFDWHQRLASKA